MQIHDREATFEKELFPFLARSRTTFYHTIGLLIFLEDNSIKFKNSMEHLLQVFYTLESTPDSMFRTDAVKFAFIGLMRDLRGIAMAACSRKSYNLLFDWLYPAHMPLLLRGISHWIDTPEVTTPLLKFMSEFVHNKTQHPTFDSNSPNGVLLFREVSKLIVAYGSRILVASPNVPDMYAFKYKGIFVSLTILSRALLGNHCNFGVLELYGDPALADALDITLKMTLAIPLADIFAYRKLTKAYFGLVEVLCSSHITFILKLDTAAFKHLVSSLESGLKEVDPSISSQCAKAIDNLATYYFNNITMVEAPTPLAIRFAQHIADCPSLFPEILKTLFEIVLFEDCGNQWSLSRPMLSLILISEQIFSDVKAKILSSQPVNQHQRLSTCFDDLMRGVSRGLDIKNRDHFTQNLILFRDEFRLG